MTSCADVRENISAYVDNELDINERISFEEHIKKCPECRIELEEMIRIISICSSIPMQPLPEGFKAELHEKLTAVAARSVNTASIRKPKKILYARTFASIAAGILLIFLGGSIVRYGLLSGGFNANKSFDGSTMAAAPAEAPADASAQMAVENEGILFNKSANGSADTQAAAGAAAADVEAAAEEWKADADYGILESSQALAMPRSYEVKRSASHDERDQAAATGFAANETTCSKSSELTIMAEDPTAVIQTVTTLASVNNAAVPEAGETEIAFLDSTAMNYSIAAGADDTRMQLQFIFTEEDYNMFTTALNDTFGAANVQMGAFVTEDCTDTLNMLIEQTNAYDNELRELQSNTDDNAKDIDKLKKEKEEIEKQIEAIRLNSDFVTVTVYINQK
jgi:anti-sigma factor RsiW